MMMARIEDSPKRMIRTDYADAWMRYGNRVSAEYSFNYVPSRSVFSVLVEPGGTAIVQYSIELDPQNFTLGTDEDETSYYTTLDIATEARTSDGLLLVANDKELFLELSPSQVQQARAFPFAFQDNFPLVPGDFTVTVILRNRVAQQYTVAERELHVPDFSREAPTLSDLVLAFDSNGVAGEFRQGEIRTYQIGDLRLEPAAENIFVIGDSVHLVTQAYGASPDHEVLFELAGADGQVLVALKSSIAPDGTVLDHLRLNDLVGGTYALKARLVSPDGQILSSRGNLGYGVTAIGRGQAFLRLSAGRQYEHAGALERDAGRPALECRTLRRSEDGAREGGRREPTAPEGSMDARECVPAAKRDRMKP